jgi:hypothetical protein
MIAVIKIKADVGVMADSEEAEEVADRVISEELERTREAIVERLVALDVEVSIDMSF